MEPKSKPLEGMLGHNSSNVPIKAPTFVKASPKDIVNGATLFRDMHETLFEGRKGNFERYQPVTIRDVQNRGDGSMRASWGGHYQTPAGYGCQSGFFDFSEQKHIPLYRLISE